MDTIAELGVAAHWAYKESVEYSKDREQFEIAQKLKWYGELLNYEIQLMRKHMLMLFIRIS